MNTLLDDRIPSFGVYVRRATSEERDDGFDSSGHIDAVAVMICNARTGETIRASVSRERAVASAIIDGRVVMTLH